MKMTTSRSIASHVTCVAASVMLVYSSLGATQDGAEILPSGMQLVTGGSHWSVRAQDAAASRTLYIESARGGGRRVLKRFAGTIPSFKAAPMGELIAVREVVSERNVGPGRGNLVREEYRDGSLKKVHDYFNSHLVLLSTDGTVLDSISAVFRYSWDPKGERIAFVTGTRDEESEFISTGTWIYDVKTKQAKQVHASGRDVAWAEWDGAVYVIAQLPASGRDGVLRYDPQTGALTGTTHKGIHFSPDGHYYYRGPAEGDPTVEVFRTAGDEPVRIDLSVEELGRRGIVNVRGWLGSDRLVGYSSVPGSGADYVLRLSTGRKQRIDGTLMQAKGRENSIWVLRGTSVSERSASSLE